MFLPPKRKVAAKPKRQPPPPKGPRQHSVGKATRKGPPCHGINLKLGDVVRVPLDGRLFQGTLTAIGEAHCLVVLGKGGRKVKVARHDIRLIRRPRC